MATASKEDYSNSKPIPTVLCSNCGTYCPVFSGTSEPGDANERRIAELEAQVILLKKTASDAVEKVTDYEDELRHLKSSSPTATSATSAVPATPGISRFGSLLSGRKTSASSASPNEPSAASIARQNSVRETELAAQLAKEQEARQLAEGKVSEMSHELEDLSVQLFQQANEMVAAERRARAKLEERVVILERRDVEKRERLERLERALRRIDRVKNLLLQQEDVQKSDMMPLPLAPNGATRRGKT